MRYATKLDTATEITELFICVFHVAVVRVAVLQEAPVAIKNVKVPSLSVLAQENIPQEIIADPGLRHWPIKYPVVCAERLTLLISAGVLVVEFTAKSAR